MFLRAKADLKRREAYLRNCRKTFYEPFARAFPKRNIADITENEAEKYVSTHKSWSSSTKASRVGYLRTFYEFFIRKDYAKLNPFRNIEKPQATSTAPKVLSPEKSAHLLQFALDNGRNRACNHGIGLFLWC
jgi:site-specific recombinase XerD